MQLNTQPFGNSGGFRPRTVNPGVKATVDSRGQLPSADPTPKPTDYTAFPTHLNNFPAAATVSFPSIQPAPYKFTDPQTYASKFADFNREQVSKNFDQSKTMALDTLDTELQGLQKYAPAAAALKREQTSIDNLFNQSARTSQVNTALPNARATLDAQAQRAASYAKGELPSDQLDRALELGTRSAATDAGTYGGFGASSGATTKMSDLMSADQRFQIAQYGEGLTSSNLTQDASLFLAPTEYSNAGAGINVAPEVGAGRLTTSDLGTLNSATVLDPAQALTSNIQQEQYKTGITQRTNEFNATGQMLANTTNAAAINDFALSSFGYDVSYTNAMTAAGQHQQDVLRGVDSQTMQNSAASSSIQVADANRGTQATTTAAGSLPAAINAVDTALGGSSTPTPTTQTQAGKSTVDTSPNTSSTAPLNDSTSLGTGTGSMVPSTIGASGTASYAPAALTFANGTAAPSGYTSVSSDGSGSYTAVPTAQYENELSRFASNNAIPAGSVSVQNAALADLSLAKGAGLSYQPLPNYAPIGVSSNGSQVYAASSMANNPNLAVGANTITSLATTLATLGVGDDATMKAMGQMAGAIGDPTTIAKLDALHADSGPTAVAQGILNSIVKDPVKYDTAAGQQTAFMAQRIGENWGMMSPAQKTLALAALAKGPALTMKTGKDIGQEVIPGTKSSVAGGLKAGDAMSLIAQGKNGYALARNWNQLSTIANLATGTKGVNQIHDFAAQNGLLGNGRSGAAIKVEPELLHKLGATPAPSAGVGAITVNQPSHIPPGYTQVGIRSNKVVAVPSPLSNTVSGKYALNGDVDAGKHPAMRLWGKSPTNGMARGSVGGSAIVAGLDRLRQLNPSLAGATIAHSLFNNILGAENG